MNLENKEWSKNGEMLKGHKSPLEGTPTVQTRDDLSIEINYSNITY